VGTNSRVPCYGATLPSAPFFLRKRSVPGGDFQAPARDALLRIDMLTKVCCVVFDHKDDGVVFLDDAGDLLNHQADGIIVTGSWSSIVFVGTSNT